MTRRNRVWSIAALAVGALAVASLSACGAGQIANTAEMVAAIQGANATATVKSTDPQYDGATIGVRNVTVDYNGPAGYPAGGTAPLTVYVVNNTPGTITLTGVTATIHNPETGADGQATVVLSGKGGTPTAAPTSAAPATTAPAATGSATGSPTGSPSPVVTIPPPVGASTFAVQVPATPAQLTGLTKANGSYLQLTNLGEAVVPGTIVHLVFTFTLSTKETVVLGDDPTQPVDAPVAPPASPGPRVSLSLSPVKE